MGQERNNNIVKGKIANALTSAAKDHIVATTDDLYDENFQEYQEDINAQLRNDIDSINIELSGVAKEDTLVSGITSIEEKIDSITLDTHDLAKEETLQNDVIEVENTINSAKEEILSAVTNIDYSAIAKQNTLVSGITDIRHDIAPLATETNATANKNEIIAAIQRYSVSPITTEQINTLFVEEETVEEG